ncbi:MAG: hypothetical protein WAW88_01255 [Nocardioides sp.]
MLSCVTDARREHGMVGPNLRGDGRIRANIAALNAAMSGLPVRRSLTGNVADR